MQYNLVYITTKDREEAERIGRALVEDRLAACVNITEGMRSIYWWGGVQQDTEAVLVAKTKQSLVAELIEKVKSMHSYECPAIVAIPITMGHLPYLEWIEKETRDSARKGQSDT